RRALPRRADDTRGAPGAARKPHAGGVAVSRMAGLALLPERDARRMKRRYPMRLASVILLLGALTASACTVTPLDAIKVNPGSLEDGMVAHWTFDEGSGDVVPDHSGNRHEGQINGGRWIDTGRFAGALHLDEGAFVSVDNFPDATRSWSVSVWVRLT